MYIELDEDQYDGRYSIGGYEFASEWYLIGVY